MAEGEHGKLDFFETMRDFRKMFPTIEDEVIEAVLRANQGAVDDTIDQLLVMSMDKEYNVHEETIPKRLGSLESASPRVDLDRRNSSNSSDSFCVSARHKTPMVDDLNDFIGLSNSSTVRHFPSKKIYRPPMVGKLPDDFLRISAAADPWAPPPLSPASRLGTRSSSSSSAEIPVRNAYWDPPPPYAVAVGASDHRQTKNHSAPPRHTYLGVFRTGSVPSSYAGSGSGALPSKRHAAAVRQRALMAESLKETMAENQWQRQIANDPELLQYLEDERIAIMLQNQEFMRELRNDREFMSALNRDVQTASVTTPAAPVPKRPSNTPPAVSDRSLSVDAVKDEDDHVLPVEPFPADPFPYTKTLPKTDADERTFQEKLALMGRSSKRKFASLARRFARKTKGARGVLDTKESYRSDALLLENSEDSDEDNHQPESGGYHQSSDADNNIGKRTDLKEGRLFSL